MKKLITLALAGCFVLGSLASAAAIDVKTSGAWSFSYGYYGNHGAYDNDKGNGGNMDTFAARMRARPKVEFIANENLSATLFFEIGVADFGNNLAQLNADQTAVKVKHAYMDWTPPSTNVSIRMGVQPLNLPTAFTADNLVFSADVAGIVASTQFTPEVGLTAFWIRPYNVYAPGDPNATTATSIGKDNKLDEMDLFGFTVPIKTQAVRFTPWGMIGSVGKDSGYNEFTVNSYDSNYGGAIGASNGRYIPKDSRKDQSLIWWLGFSFDVPALDPFILKGDAVYGQQQGDDDWGTKGWYAALQAGYKWGWGSTSLAGWYASGDSGKWGDNKEGTVPVVGDDGGFSIGSFAFGGNSALTRDNVIAGNGTGTWGLGVRVENVSFVQNLTHRFDAYYIRGTHSGERIPNGYERAFYPGGAADGHKGYLISTDSAWDFTLYNSYQVNQNLKVNLDFSYIDFELSKQRASNSRDTTGAYAGVLSFHYNF